MRTDKVGAKKVKPLLLVFSMALMSFLSSCALYDMKAFLVEEQKSDGFQVNVFSGEQFTLSWNAPQSAPQKYIVCYRPHGASENSWIDLGETADVSFNVMYESIGKNGEYDFAVFAINEDGEKYEHMSLDPTAEPPTGWFIRWTR